MMGPNILTRADSERLEVNKNQWAQTLALALRKWCEHNGYVPRNKLATELEIQARQWQTLTIGEAITKDVTIYARLHVRTGLPEADPREIPPRTRYVAKSQYYLEEKRAWTDKEYDRWRKGYQAAPSPDKLVQEISPSGTGRETETEPQTLGSLVDRFFASSEERIARRVVEMLRQEREDSGDIGKLADRLFQVLEKYLDGTPEDRDRLMAQFGKTHLSRLFSLLRDLSSEDREVVLQLNQTKRRK